MRPAKGDTEGHQRGEPGAGAPRDKRRRRLVSRTVKPMVS